MLRLQCLFFRRKLKFIQVTKTGTDAAGCASHNHLYGESAKASDWSGAPAAGCMGPRLMGNEGKQPTGSR
jgi:hypothetical protein